MAALPIVLPRCSKCEGCQIHHRAVCRGAGPEAIAYLNRISHLHTYNRGEVIQAQGEESLVVGNVISGVIKVVMSSQDGNQHIVGLLFSSDFIGRVFREQSRFSYEAATDATLCSISRPLFERFLADHPQVEHELLVNTLDELDAMREWAYIVSAHTTMQRVASFLYVLARRARNQGCEEEGGGNPVITIPISRRDIAAYLGTTPETLSRNIQSLARQKVFRIINAKRFELLNEAELLAQAGESAEDLMSVAMRSDETSVAR